MPLTPLNNDFLQCPICFNAFNVDRKPVTLICCHTCCSSCLKSLQNCPFDQTIINHDLPENEAILSIISINQTTSVSNLLNNYLSNVSNLNNDKLINIFKLNQNDLNNYRKAIDCIQSLAQLIKPQNSSCNLLSRPMQRKLISLLHCQLIEDECRLKCIRICRSIGERITSELLLKHQDPYTLSSNLWACVRSRGCQFLGPALQEEILKLVLSALEDGSHLSRKVLVMFVVQRLSPNFPQQASKTAIGHVIQLLYRASCFRLTKRDGDSSLMQLKEEYCSYDALRREHDTQIVSIALESGLKISPDQWSSFLYGSSAYKSHMQSIIDKLQSPQSFNQSIQELIIALQRTADPANLINLKDHLERLAKIDSTGTESVSTTNQQQQQNTIDEIKDDQQIKQNEFEQTSQQPIKEQKELQYPTYEESVEILESCKLITFRLVDFLKQYNTLFSNIFRFNRNTNYGNTSKFKNTKTTFNLNQQTSKSPNEENKTKFDNLLNNQNLLNNFKPISNLSSNVTLNQGINTIVNTTGKLDYSTNSINSLNTTIQSIQSLNSLNSLNSINKLTNGTTCKPCAHVQPTVLQQQNGNCLNTITNNNNLKQNKIKIANNLFNNQKNYYANQKVSKLNDQNKYQQSNLTANKLNSINLSNNKLTNHLKLDSTKLFNSNITNENQKNNQNIQNNQQFKNQLPLSPILKHEFDNQLNDLNTLIQPKSKSAKKSNHNSFSFDDDDQFIPFDCDQPKISKFGPISRLNLINTQTVTGALTGSTGLKTENGTQICKNTNVVLGALPSLIRPFNSSLFISNDISK